MLKSKKIVSLVLTLILTVSMCLLAIPTASAVSDNVSLLYASIEPSQSTVYGGHNVIGYVEVNNLAYDKKVVIHYSQDEINWYDIEATYFKESTNNKEIWKFVLPEVAIIYKSVYDCEFAIKYEVNGQTYWDNNNGANYYVRKGYGYPNTMALGASKHKLQYSQYSTYNGNYIYGTVQLQNLAYTKDVKIRYTTDNWQTYQEASAAYSHETNSTSNPTIEAWNFEIDIPTTVTNVKFAVSYTVNGQSHWDNNFGDNYSIDTVTEI